MTINLKLLSVFVLVAEHCSFRKAADELGRSQSAVSTQIRQLEEQLGVALFHRTTRRVVLSPEGRELLTFVQQALSQIQTGVEAIANVVEQQRASVRVAFSSITAAAQLTPILADFKAAYPQVRVHVRELTPAEMLACIERDELDFGIGPGAHFGVDFHFEVIVRPEICVVVPMEFPVGTEAEISLDELNRLTVLINESTILRSFTDHSMFEEQLKPELQYEGLQVQTMLSLVEAGLGAALLPRLAIPPSNGRKFRTLSIKPPIIGEICIITVPGKVLSPFAARFAETAKRVLQEGIVHAG